MKLSFEVKDGERITTCTADLAETEKTIRAVADKVESFLKKTFQVETFVKKESKEEAKGAK